MLKQKCGKLPGKNLFLKGFFAIFICFMTNICFLSVQTYAVTSSPVGGYKKTAELTDNDRSDAHQKNYQQADKSTDTSFLYKSAEWSNKDAKEGKITLTAQQPLSSKKTCSAVYAFNVCEAHGFSKNIAKKNIDFLLKNFGRVDVIRTGVITDETTYTMEDIKSFDDVHWPARPAGQEKITCSHRSVTLYEGLRKYLKNHKPTCIYVSFDMFYIPGITYLPQVPAKTEIDDKTGMKTTTFYPSGELGKATTMPGIPDTMNEDCFDILKRYKNEGRYFSMACGYDGKAITKNDGMYMIGGGPETPVIAKGKQETLGQERFFYSANIIAALADPNVWPGRETAKKQFWNGEAYNPTNIYSNSLLARESGQKLQGFKGVAPDYPYNKDLETMKVSVAKHSLRITDTVADIFEIISATSENPKAKIRIDGNTVSALLEDYDGTAPLVVTIKVKLSGKKRAEVDETAEAWRDTNKGEARVYFSENGKEIEVSKVESPKLFIAKEQFSALSRGRLAPYIRRSTRSLDKSELGSEQLTKSEPESAPTTTSKFDQSARSDLHRPESPKPAQPRPEQSKPALPKPETSKTAPKPAQPKRELSKTAARAAQPKPASSQLAHKPASAKPKKRLPGTEDATDLLMPIGIGVLGATGIAGALSIRRKKGGLIT